MYDWVKKIQATLEQESEQLEIDKTPFIDGLLIIIHEGWEIVRKVLLSVIIRIAIGAAMHGYIPENFFTAYLSADKW